MTEKISGTLKAAGVWASILAVALWVLSLTGARWVRQIEQVPILESQVTAIILAQAVRDRQVEQALSTLASQQKISDQQAITIMRKIDALLIRAGLDPDAPRFQIAVGDKE